MNHMLIDDSKAPWNDKILPVTNCKVDIVVSIRKKVTIPTDNYTIIDSYVDEDGDIQKVIEFHNEEEDIMNSSVVKENIKKLIDLGYTIDDIYYE